MAINIRRATSEDIEVLWAVRTTAILGIIQKYYTKLEIDTWASTPKPNNFDVVIQKLDWYIAEEDGAIAGSGFLDRDTGEIGGIFVSPNFQRKKIGLQILNHLEEIAKEHKIGMLYLDATLNAVAFYKAAGYFTITKSKYHHVSGLAFDCLRMEKNITAERVKVKNYLIVVQCGIEHDGKFLIIKRPVGKDAGGLLAFPGGKIDEQDELHHFDLLRNAVKREILEEVGLILLDPIHYVSSSYFVDSHGNQVIATIFHCMLNKTVLNVIPCKREVPEYYWMDQAEINQATNAPDWLKNDVALIANNRS